MRGGSGGGGEKEEEKNQKEWRKGAKKGETKEVQ